METFKVIDLNSFESYINKLFNNNLPLSMDKRDLSSKVESGTFNERFEDWDESKSPVDSSAYKEYVMVAKTFKRLIGVK